MKKGKKALIIVLAALLTVSVLTVVFIFVRKTALDRAVKAMDVNETQSVIRVMKLGSKNVDIVAGVAAAYLEAGYKDDAALTALYILQYLDGENTTAKEIVSKCYKSELAVQFADLDIEVKKFETVTQNGDYAYGVADGIYCEFLGGYAKAKISPVMPQQIYAAQDGAYILDSSDRIIKFIKKDGSELSAVTNKKADEFVYSGGCIYYIDQNGQPQGDGSISLAEGEFAMDLRIEADGVYCTVYDSNFEALREQKIKAS